MGAGPPEVRASGSPELRGRLRQNGLGHLSRGSSEPRVGRMSQAKRFGSPREQHFGAQSCEDVSGETGWTSSRVASWSPGLRMSQAKRARQPRARHLGARSCEDVSGETRKTPSRAASGRRRPEDVVPTMSSRSSHPDEIASEEVVRMKCPDEVVPDEVAIG